MRELGTGPRGVAVGGAQPRTETRDTTLPGPAEFVMPYDTVSRPDRWSSACPLRKMSPEGNDHIRSLNRATLAAARTNLAKAQGGYRAWQQVRRICVGSVSQRSFRVFFDSCIIRPVRCGGEEHESTFLS